VKAFVTGGTGFLGGRLVTTLRERRDEVVALVRSPAKAERLGGLGCELVTGELSSRAALARAMAGCDAVFHVAAVYRIGIPESEREAMFDANVTGTVNVLDAGADAGVNRIVYVSTNSVLGNTRGAVVDETYQRDRDQGFLSAYDESKLIAHDAALKRIAQGAPIVIVQPGGIYGPGDHTAMGAMLAGAFRGKPTLLPFGGVGLNWVHVDDVVAGILLAHDRGAIGQTYILGGEIATLRRAVEEAYAAGGHRARILPVPSVVLRALAPLGPLLGRNVREYLSASDGVTYWGKDEKARRELGHAPRELAAGLRDSFAPG
jgi:nucleoside-diphosphate-sugar epimerase